MCMYICTHVGTHARKRASIVCIRRGFCKLQWRHLANAERTLSSPVCAEELIRVFVSGQV